MALRASLQLVADATTAGADAAAKTLALTTGLTAAVAREIGVTYGLNANQANKVTDLVAELTAENATIVTALEVA